MSRCVLGAKIMKEPGEWGTISRKWVKNTYLYICSEIKVAYMGLQTLWNGSRLKVLTRSGRVIMMGMKYGGGKGYERFMCTFLLCPVLFYQHGNAYLYCRNNREVPNGSYRWLLKVWGHFVVTKTTRLEEVTPNKLRFHSDTRWLLKGRAEETTQRRVKPQMMVNYLLLVWCGEWRL